MGASGMPLDGLVVADFSRILAGPLATVMLADLGATVVKVERPGQGDDTRAWGPPWSANSSSYFECANRSKRSVTLDFADAKDLEIARRLVARADVVVENFRSGTMGRWGLDYDAVRVTNPGVVYCSVTGFGAGAGAAMSGYDFLVQAVGGLMSITGESQGEPTKVGVALVDVMTAKDAVMGILAALRVRDRTGLGQQVEVNLLSSLLGGMVNQASSYLATGRPPQRMGNRHPSIAPYETLACRDALIVVACGNDLQFRRLVGVLDGAPLADDGRFAHNDGRVAHRAELVCELERLLAEGDADDWVARLAEVGVPAGRIGTVADGVRLATELGLGPVVHLDGDATPQVRHPVTYGMTPVTAYSAPPQLGDFNDDIEQWLDDALSRPA